MSEPVLCACPCHSPERIEAQQARDNLDYSEAYRLSQSALRYQGVPVTDVTEAAAACPACLDRHTPALLARFIWRDDPPPPDPAAFCSED